MRSVLFRRPDRAAPPPLDLGRRLRECDEFFALPELAGAPPDRRRRARDELRRTGTYTHTSDEILIGAQLAWRNHARCVGRKFWKALALIDARHLTSAPELAEACWQHLSAATNGGAIRCLLTVGPPRDADGREFRILSSQLIRYAGYRRPDGTVLGDPGNTRATDLAQRLGWRGAGTPFDVLPLLIRTPEGAVHWFEVPPELVREVDIEHPEFGWFPELELKWHALPAVSNMDLEIGGVTYPFAPFNGWYMGAEIGARNLSDTDRYDMLPAIADRMDLDRSADRTMWRDQALVELNRAVLYSFQRSGVRIVDHHTAARQFCEHVEREAAAGRRCPTDWTWVNPPLSSGLTPTFHRYFDPPDPELRPAFAHRAES
ncbi:nitric oxide synthase oxygenase [Nocardia stercoris]|uniref:Nitric oxide synthase oxygenase n=1 Tax=Nocardia stercoris TaxID=2483361 RepID=A0A3M2L5Q3_9NOCA|nr:nitric oxide synthase oxygenase [Nocardia stercoris]RMI32979.1 nitric oxide synthase oxygenase [Nocardia stercoris]